MLGRVANEAVEFVGERVAAADDVGLAQDTVRLYVIESQVLFGKALCQVISHEGGSLQIVGDAGAPSAAAIARARPQLILLGLDTHGFDVTEAIRICRNAAPEAKICVLSMRPQAEVMQRCLAAGAEGYIMKDVTPQEVMRAIRMVADGLIYVDPRVAGGLLRRRSLSVGRDMNELSARETEVIRFISEGLSNKEISARLSLSEKTVKNHISRIFSKLNICARTQAAVYAIKNGLA
jgi:DNA-binding NarL/FixJ family response regulator